MTKIADLMKNAGLATDKSLGQHFIFDLNITDKIARAVPDLDKMNIIEVGPGAGSLTTSLVRCGAKSVLAIEKDARMIPLLEKIEGARVIQKDALKLGRDFYESVPAPRAIVSNLPYNVGTELLIGWLQNSDLFSSLTLMFQREVAQRIVATPGSKKYGRLSVLAAMHTQAKILFPVARSAFNPPPKVENAIVSLVPHRKYPKELCRQVERISALLFANRRKMVRSALPGFDWAAVGLTGTERAEDLTLQDFIKVSENSQPQ